MVTFNTFRCPSKRKKNFRSEICGGLMGGYPVGQDHVHMLCWCPKCSIFYLASPINDNLYQLKRLNKAELKFISQPYVYEDFS